MKYLIFFLILNESRDREKDFDQNTIIIGFLNGIKIEKTVIFYIFLQEFLRH